MVCIISNEYLVFSFLVGVFQEHKKNDCPFDNKTTFEALRQLVLREACRMEDLFEAILRLVAEKYIR